MATSSEEDYLRAIYELDNGTGMVRSVDVATALGVSKPSVNKALTVLEEEGFITRMRYAPIQLKRLTRWSMRCPRTPSRA